MQLNTGWSSCDKQSKLQRILCSLLAILRTPCYLESEYCIIFYIHLFKKRYIFFFLFFFSYFSLISTFSKVIMYFSDFLVARFLISCAQLLICTSLVNTYISFFLNLLQVISFYLIYKMGYFYFLYFRNFHDTYDSKRKKPAPKYYRVSFVRVVPNSCNQRSLLSVPKAHFILSFRFRKVHSIVYVHIIALLHV